MKKIDVTALLSQLKVVETIEPMKPDSDHVSFEKKLTYWEEKFGTLLAKGYRTRSIDAADAGDEISILKAYDEGEDEFGFLLIGQAGVGKTYVLTALLNKVLEACHRYQCSFSDYVAYYPIGYLIYKLRSEKNSDAFATCMNVRFLFLDDLGSENTTDFAREHFFTILDLRCQRKMPTFITTNLQFNELREKYGERLTSRLTEMCVPLQLRGTDRRKDFLKERVQILKARGAKVAVGTKGESET